ncbi:MAG: membrane protein insertase YidC [Candidatus Omnitrophica bacterium]|nr:membrane protein insertase YidC [Candidatus Omnitrophota bacterium]
MEKRLIVAIALSIFIIISFQYFVVKPTLKTTATEVTTTQGPAPTVARESKPPEIAQPKISFEEKESAFETDKYILVISNVGGAIKEIRLKDYDDLRSKEPFVLVRIKNPNDYIFAVSDPLARTLPAALEYEIRQKDNAVICSARTGDLEITKKYILRNSKQYIELQLLIKNISGFVKNLNYRVIGGAGVSETADQDKRLIEVTSKINGKPVGFKRLRKLERIFNPGVVGWTDLKSKYFSVILKPSALTKGQFYSEDSDGNLVMGVETEDATIQPGSSIENKYILYAGPSSIPVLKAQGYDFEETVNYGFFGGIAKAIIVVLKFFYALFHNWGISIILLAIFLNIILFPLTMKSFRSMQKMQELHPQMEKLKVQYKADPKKLNKEIMELYKKYNINPMSGCLPMLLQMPIFVALYQALMKSIELRNARFLWIRDLSSPEAVPLPISFPIIGSTINILPLIMIAAMVLQQKVSTKSMGSAVTEEQKQQQKMMLIMMPVIFGFIFYNMPSGLVLYWVVNTLLTIIEQRATLRNAEVS